jgi:hypothetical protein
MAIKTFTTGEVLTAADTNTYLTNSGLVYITEANPNAVASVSVNNCFSATYNAYRIVWVPTAYSFAGQTQTFMRLRVGGADNANNNYLRSRWYYGAGGFSGTDGGAVAGDRWDFADTNTVLHPISVDVYSPFQTIQTSAGSKAVAYQGASATLYGIETAATTTVTTSYDGFSWFPSNGTFTGKLLVYGYRQA